MKIIVKLLIALCKNVCADDPIYEMSHGTERWYDAMSSLMKINDDWQRDCLSLCWQHCQASAEDVDSSVVVLGWPVFVSLRPILFQLTQKQSMQNVSSIGQLQGDPHRPWSFDIFALLLIISDNLYINIFQLYINLYLIKTFFRVIIWIRRRY